jgi:hypothetical protein
MPDGIGNGNPEGMPDGIGNGKPVGAPEGIGNGKPPDPEPEPPNGKGNGRSASLATGAGKARAQPKKPNVAAMESFISMYESDGIRILNESRSCLQMNVKLALDKASLESKKPRETMRLFIDENFQHKPLKELINKWTKKSTRPFSSQDKKQPVQGFGCRVHARCETD